jgi:hypothetical protein
MANRTEHHKKAMIEALEKTLGVVTKACEMVGIGRTQYYTWLKEDEEFAQQVQDIENVALDFAESSLHEQIKDKVPTSTIFYLKTKGRKRGYIETKDITNNGGSFTNPFEGLTLEQLEKLSKLGDDDSAEDID